MRGLIILIVIFLISIRCSPNVVTKPPDYPYSLQASYHDKSVFSGKINILLLPVSDSRNMPPNYVGRNDVYPVYYTEPVSSIVRKAIQTELMNNGYHVQLCDEIKAKEHRANSTLYLKVYVMEFLADWVVKTFHDIKPISISLNVLLIDNKGNVIARNQFSHTIKGLHVGPLKAPKIARSDAKKHCSYLITHVLPKVSSDTLVWINDNLSGKYRAREIEQGTKQKDLVTKLKQLKEMKEKQLITEEEYQNKKKEILRNL